MVKISGMQWSAFLAQAIVGGAYADDYGLIVNGVRVPDGESPDIDGTDVVEIDGGYIERGGRRKDDLEQALQSWLEQQATRVVLVRVELAKAEAVLAAIKAAGGEIIS